MAKDNRLLGQFKLDGIEMAPRGTPQIEVTFDIDANGVLNVSAKDKKTGKENNVVIKSSGGLDKDEIDDLIKQAEANAQADEQKAKLVEAKNKLDQEIYQVEKLINENKENFPADAIEELESAIRDARDTQDGENLEEIEAASAKLMSVAQSFAQKAQAAESQAGSAQAAGPTEGASDDGPIDVEVEDVSPDGMVLKIDDEAIPFVDLSSEEE